MVKRVRRGHLKKTASGGLEVADENVGAVGVGL